MFGYILNSKCATKEILYRLDRTMLNKKHTQQYYTHLFSC